MTQTDYINSGCENRHALFTFSNGDEISGVITTFFFDEPNRYYLVRTPNMIEFKKYMDINDHAKMKSLCTLVDLEKVVDVELMEPISFTIRANIAFQRLSYEAQREAQNLLQKLVKDDSALRTQQVINIKDKPHYVIRLDERIRLLIQRKKYGVTVNDIIFNK